MYKQHHIKQFRDALIIRKSQLVERFFEDNSELGLFRITISQSFLIPSVNGLMITLKNCHLKNSWIIRGLKKSMYINT